MGPIPNPSRIPIGLADRAEEFVRGFPPLTWSCTLMRWRDSWLVFSDAGIGEPLCLDSAGAVGSGRAEEEKKYGLDVGPSWWVRSSRWPLVEVCHA